MPRGVRLSDEARVALVADYRAGMTWRSLAARYDLRTSGVSVILRKEGVMPPRKEDPNMVERVTALYESGAAAGEIERMTGIERHRVAQLLHAGGVILRPKNRRFIDSVEHAISIRYSHGERLADIATDYSVSTLTVRAAAGRRGAAIRPSGAVRKRTMRDDAFATITPESAYWIGMMMADGWVRPSRGVVALGLAGDDGGHVAAFRDFLGYDGKLYKRAPRNGDSGATIVTVCSRPMCADLARYGVLPAKSFTAKVSGDLAFNRDFWRGAIDGDGTVGWNHSGDRSYPYIRLVGSFDMMRQFKNYCDSIYPRPGTHVRRKDNIWKYQVSSRPAVAVIRDIYADTPLALVRKRRIADEIIHASQHT